MKHLSFFKLSLMLLMLAGSALAQTSYPIQIENQPCIAEAGASQPSGRPTLKRRPTTSDPKAPDEGNLDQKSVAIEKCKPQDPNADLINGRKLLRVQFEGLHALTGGDVVLAFRESGIVLPQTQMSAAELSSKGVTLLKQLLESRGYFDASINTREDAAGGTIVFLVAEGSRLPLAEVQFEGNKNFSSQELASKIKGYLAYYEKTEEYDADRFEFALRSLLNFVRSRGYLQATFAEPTRERDARGVVLTVAVDEGVVYRLGEIRIKGAEVIAPVRIREMLDLEQGDVASGERLGKWLYEDLKRVYGELGFIQYTAEIEPEFKVATKTANEGVVDLIVNIEEGRRFRVRRIKFQGNGLTDEELLRLMGIRAGDVFNDRLFEESIRELNKLGLFEPIDKDKDTDFSTNEEEGLVDIVIKLNALNSGTLGQ
jgi:outer membrane protein insertion porin family